MDTLWNCSVVMSNDPDGLVHIYYSSLYIAKQIIKHKSYK